MKIIKLIMMNNISDQKTNSEKPANVFTNMFSLLKNQGENNEKQSNSLVLPDLNKFHDEILPENTANEIIKNKKYKRKNRHKKVTACPHIYKKYYAKSMCNSCYHRFGRASLAWDCEHTDKKLYAKGKCEGCYIKQYLNLNSNP